MSVVMLYIKLPAKPTRPVHHVQVRELNFIGETAGKLHCFIYQYTQAECANGLSQLTSKKCVLINQSPTVYHVYNDFPFLSK